MMKTIGKKVLCLRNIAIFRNNIFIPHSSILINKASNVIICFESQKNNLRNKIITLHMCKNRDLSSVKILIKLVTRLRTYKRISNNSIISLLQDESRRQSRIKSKTIKDHLKFFVRGIGFIKLGFKYFHIGTHSIRSSTAMALYLAKIDPVTIMILGRWKSDSFILYIRTQV